MRRIMFIPFNPGLQPALKPACTLAPLTPMCDEVTFSVRPTTNLKSVPARSSQKHIVLESSIGGPFDISRAAFTVTRRAGGLR